MYCFGFVSAYFVSTLFSKYQPFYLGITISFDPTIYNVNEGETANLILRLSDTAYNFNFSVTITSMDISATG